MRLRRWRGVSEKGNAIILALVVVAVIGGIIAALFARASDTQQRSHEGSLDDRSALAARSALALAIQRVQRVGSSQADETQSSLLDWPNRHGTGPGGERPNERNCTTDDDTLDGGLSDCLNPSNPKDGAYKFVIRSVPDNPKHRQVIATGFYGPYVTKRTLTFEIIPRVYRYALFANGAGGAQPAIRLKNRAYVYAPPTYKGTEKAMGGDIGANNRMTFDTGAALNSRLPNPDFYDQLFLPAERQADPTKPFYNGVPWGYLTRAPGQTTRDEFTVTINGAADPQLPHGNINMRGDEAGAGTWQVRTAATATELPIYTQKLVDWRAQAQANTANNYAVDDDPDGTPPRGSLYTSSQFKQLLQEHGPQITLTGMVYVEHRPIAGETSCTIDLEHLGTRLLLIEDGALIIHGCDLEIGPDTTFRAVRPISDPEEEIHRLPALMLLKNTYGQGGSLHVASSDENFTSIQGVTYVDGDLTVSGTSDAPDHGGNFSNSGAVVVAGRFSVEPRNGGRSWVVLRWHPIAQEIDFVPEDGAMGTYTVRTSDRPLPTQRPVVEFTKTPDNPTTSRTADFQWKVIGDWDTLHCSYREGDGSWEKLSCNTLSYRFTDLKRNVDHSFKVVACVLGVDANENPTQLCSDEAIYTWRVLGSPPTVTFTTTPPHQDTNRTPEFRWTIINEYVSVACFLDGNPLPSCTTDSSHKLTQPLSYGNHTFAVQACNDVGCDTAVYAWRVTPVAPRLTFVSVPPNPAAHSMTTASFVVRNDGGPATLNCRLDQGSWTTCPIGGGNGTIAGNGAQVTMSLAVENCADHTLTVRASNESGSDTISHSWHVNCPPPDITITSAPAHVTFDTGTIEFRTTNGARVECSLASTNKPCDLFDTASQQGSVTWTGKPYYCHTARVRVWNKDETAYKDATYNWCRYNIDMGPDGERLINGSFDAGGRWNYWYAGAGGFSTWGSCHTPPECVFTYNQWAAYGWIWGGGGGPNLPTSVGYFKARGDDLRFMTTRYYGSGETMITDGSGHVYSGMNWNHSGGWGNMYAPATYTGSFQWHRLRTDLAITQGGPQWIRWVIKGGNHSYNNGQSYGYIYDSGQGTGSRCKCQGWTGY